MNHMIRLATHSAWNRRSTLLWVVVSIALSSLLMLTLERIRTDARASFRQAVSGTDLIVGARTSPTQLLLYAVFHSGSPTHNIRMSSLQALAEHPSIDWVVPLSLGDSHRGFSVLGTQANYFEHFRYGDKQRLRLSEGRPFETGLAGLYEAVLGAEVAQSFHYQIGQDLTLSHGIGGGGLSKDHADKPFRVAGILARTGTPVDRTVHVSLESLSAIHLDWVAGMPIPGMTIPAAQARKFDLSPTQATAALVGLKSRSAVFAVQRDVAAFADEPLLGILPGVALDELWDVVGLGEKALLAMSGMVALVSVIGLVAVVLAGLNERRRELAVLRAVGASPGHIALLLTLEGTLLTLLGLGLGITLTGALTWAAAPWAQSTYGIGLRVWPPTASQWGLLGCVFVAGLIASTLPAWRAYRFSLADGLTPPA
jgi:putative ABC transport system permease protein